MEANEHARSASPPEWDKWPSQITVGNCKITIYHSEDSPPQALTLLAEPANCPGHSGASISCFLPVKDTSDVVIRPPISTYWSSRRRGPHTKVYFSKDYPKLEVALLHSLSKSGARAERIIAASYILLSGYREEFEVQDGDNISSLINDDARFTAIANRWIEVTSKTMKGHARIEAARKHVEKAAEWFQSLENFAALTTEATPDSKGAKLTQTAVYKAIRDAAVAHGGVPRLGEVREAYREVGLGWDKIKSNSLEARQELHFDAFDTAIKNLGFSWLPLTWDSVK